MEKDNPFIDFLESNLKKENLTEKNLTNSFNDTFSKKFKLKYDEKIYIALSDIVSKNSGITNITNFKKMIEILAEMKLIKPIQKRKLLESLNNVEIKKEKEENQKKEDKKRIEEKKRKEEKEEKLRIEEKIRKEKEEKKRIEENKKKELEEDEIKREEKKFFFFY